MYWAPPKWPRVSTIVVAFAIALGLFLLALSGFSDVVKVVCVIAMFVVPWLAIRQRPDIWRADLRRRSDKRGD